MSEKRFVLCKKGDVEYIEDNGCVQLYGFDVLCEMLNELNDENEQLRQQLKQKEEEEKLYAREIVELNKTKNEMLNFKELGGDY